jgi:hypothetical protein
VFYLRYYVSGDKKGKTEVFANLPGFSDTIRLTEHGTLLVPFALVRYSKLFSLLDLTGKYPFIRKLIGYVNRLYFYKY